MGYLDVAQTLLWRGYSDPFLPVGSQSGLRSPGFGRVRGLLPWTAATQGQLRGSEGKRKLRWNYVLCKLRVIHTKRIVNPLPADWEGLCLTKTKQHFSR